MPAQAERPDTTGLRVPPFFYFVAAYLVGVALELAFPFDWPSAEIRIVATLAAAAIWLALDGAAIVLFGAKGTSIWPMEPDAALVTGGPYRISRNPQYLGIAFFYLAFAFAFRVMWALALLPGILIFIDRAVIPREEAYLQKRFGQSYLDYKAGVRRWI